MKLNASILISCALIGAPALAAPDSQTTSRYQKQVSLMKTINAAQKSRQITVKQAKSLRKDLSKIAIKKQKVANENKLEAGSANMSDVDEKLNDTANKINEAIRENREDMND